MAIKTISDATFDTDVIKSPIPVLVEFWADWSIGNANIGPDLQILSEELRTQVSFTRLDIETSTATPNKYNIRAVPYLLLFNKGRKVAQLTGQPTKAQIRKLIKDNVDI